MSDAEVSKTPTGSISVRTSDDVPVVVRVEQAHGAMLQNLGAIAAIVSFVLTGHISGEVGLGAIMVVAGIIAYPGMRKNGTSALIGSIGVLSGAWELLRSFHAAIPFAVFAAAAALSGCGGIGDVRNDLNAMQLASERVGVLVKAACPVDLPAADPLFRLCVEGRSGFNDVADIQHRLQDRIDSVTQ